MTFDVEIAGGLEASVYAIAQKKDAAAPQNYSDFDAFEDKVDKVLPSEDRIMVSLDRRARSTEAPRSR